MKPFYIFTFMLLCVSACNQSQHTHTYEERVVDAMTLPECPAKVIKSGPKDYVTFTSDDKYVLYVATKGDYMCLKRPKK